MWIGLTPLWINVLLLASYLVLPAVAMRKAMRAGRAEGISKPKNL